MVELTTGAATAVAGGGAAVAVVLLAALVVLARRSRATTRRLAAVASRLEQPGEGAGDERDVVGRVERQAASALLRLSDAEARAERLAGALAHVGAGVVVCDEQGAVVHRSGAVPDEVGEAAAAVLHAALGGDGARSRTVESGAKAFRVTGHAVDDGRRVVGAVAVVDDVSERRRLDAAHRDFLANVTAELGTPVGALGLLAGAIVAEDDPALTRRLAGRLERDALRVGRLVGDLAELGRLDAEALPDRRPVPLDLVVAQAVEDARPVAPGRSVAVDPSPCGATVVGDRRQLASAVRHLVENALGSSADGGTVRVRLACAGGWAEVAVTDDGPGINAAALERVFDGFYRAAPDGTRAPAGTGVGLAIAARVAAAHGGRVAAASTEGAGSTFTLSLPVASEAAA